MAVRHGCRGCTRVRRVTRQASFATKPMAATRLWIMQVIDLKLSFCIAARHLALKRLNLLTGDLDGSKSIVIQVTAKDLNDLE